MLKTANPNISIITNFGCRANCWYCIWKGHRLEKVSEPTDWNKLYKFLYENKDKGKVSVSGGGDCLYRFDEYMGWWVTLLGITTDLKMLVDVHTREKFTHPSFYKKYINKCVFSSDNLDDDREYLKYLSGLCMVRITHLVTAKTTNKMIDDYLDFQQEICCQFTIKELVGFDDEGRYKQLRKEYQTIFHLDYGDYNTYFMPDNTITESFL